MIDTKSLLTRTLSGIVIAIAVIGAALAGQYTSAATGRYVYVALLSVIALFSIREFLALAWHEGAQSLRHITTIAGVMPIILSLWGERGMLFSIVLFVILIPLLLIVELWRQQSRPIFNFAVSLGAWGYITVPLLMLAFWSDTRIFLAYIITIWANDVGAYLVGVTCGRHKMFPRISPKKSWEGFAGGVCAGMIVAALSTVYGFGQPLIIGVGAGVIICATAVLGDLVESLMKRAAGVKDSSNIIPGHGGFLDRFDAVFISAPFISVYLYFIYL